MATVPLREVVAAAHSALEAGDHTLARAACQHILAHFPHFADMHRLSGEIALEQGDTDAARVAFEQALGSDPQNVLAWLGLGVIAEENLDVAGAAGHFQRALEIDPALTQLRDELVRLYGKLYGQGGRLHITGPGLAAIQARGNQLTLATQQYEAALAQQPDRIDLALALAEVRWRAGDDAAAQQLCQRVLVQQPDTVRALYIQADLYRRHGATTQAREAFGQALAIDPLGAVLEHLKQLAPDSPFESFAGSESMIAPFEPPAAVEAQPAVTTNSTLGALPVADDSEWQRVASQLGDRFMPAPGSAAGAPALAATAAPADLMPAAGEHRWPWESEGGLTLDDLPALDEPALAGAPPAPAASAPPRADLTAVQPGGPLGNGTTSGLTDTIREIDALGFKPFALEALDTSDDDIMVDDGAADELVSLDSPAAPAAPAGTVAEEDASAALQELVGNWDKIDQELAAAMPSDADASVEELAAQMGLVDVAPFSATGEADDGGASRGSTWDGLDAVLTRATPPSPPAGGFTAEPPRFEEEPVEPFSFEDLDLETAASASGTPTPERVGGDRESVSPTTMPAAPVPSWADLEAETHQPPPSTTTLSAGFTNDLLALQEQGLTPFDPAEVPTTAEESLPASFEAALDWSSPDTATASVAATEPSHAPLADDDEATPRDAQPGTGPLLAGFTDELQALEADGVAPFTMEDEAAALTDGPLAPDLTSQDDMEATLGLAPLFSPPEPSPYHPSDDLAAKPSRFTEELERARPGTDLLLDGLTRQLRELDVQGVQPFTFDEPAPAEPLLSELDVQGIQPVTFDEPALAEPPLGELDVQDVQSFAFDEPALAEPLLDELDVQPFSFDELAAAEPPLPIAAAAPLAEPALPAPPAPEPEPVRPISSVQPASGGPAAALPFSPYRQSEFDILIGLTGSLIDRLRERKQQMMAQGHLTRSARSAAVGSGAAKAALARQVAEAEGLVDDTPDDVEARLTLAQRYTALGRAADAAGCYHLLLRAEPDLLPQLVPSIEALAASYPLEPKVARLLGDLYLRQGRYSHAATVFKSLLVNGAHA